MIVEAFHVGEPDRATPAVNERSLLNEVTSPAAISFQSTYLALSNS
jgi:hypothetical protein